MDLTSLEAGAEYSPPDVASLGGVGPLTSYRDWTGIVEFGNRVALFSTLIKDDLPPERAFGDALSDPELLRESQSQDRQDSRVFLRLMSLESPSKRLGFGIDSHIRFVRPTPVQ